MHLFAFALSTNMLLLYGIRVSILFGAILLTFAFSKHGKENRPKNEDDKATRATNEQTRLVKGTGPTVYLLRNDVLHHIVKHSTLTKLLMLKHQKVEMVSDTFISQFQKGHSFTSDHLHEGEFLFPKNCLKAEETATTSHEGVLFIPGLGSPLRLPVVAKNLEVMRHKFNSSVAKWDCVVYLYAPPESDFWLEREYLQGISSLCAVVQNPNRLFEDHVKMFQPALMKEKYKYVFLLLDDVVLESSFDIDVVIDIMTRNNLTFVSPYINNADDHNKILMHIKAPNGSLGFATNYIETFALVMTFPAYIAFWEIFDPLANPCGWGPDHWCVHLQHISSLFLIRPCPS